MTDFKMASLALLAAVLVPAAAANLPPGVVAVPLTRAAQQDAYYAEFHVGTPPQRELLKIDTGSPRFSFMDPRNPLCVADTQRCRTFGTFDNTTSSTCRFKGIGFADDLGPVGLGDYLSDILVVGGVTVKKMLFGYTSRYSFPNHVIGDLRTILGLSLECGSRNTTCSGKGAYFLPQLKKASLIHRMATSFYFGPDDADVPNSQMLVGGAYDKAKVDGELFTVNMVDPYNMELTGGQTNVVNVTAMEVVVDGNRTAGTYGDKGVGVPVLLDSGISRWYLPEPIFDVVFQALGGRQRAPPGSEKQVIDCMYRDAAHAKGYVSVEFGAAGTIQVPLHTLVSKFPDGTCASFIEPRGNTVSTLGDPFLRGTYIIYDQENWTVSMGQVKYTDEQNIVPFPRGGFKARS